MEKNAATTLKNSEPKKRNIIIVATLLIAVLLIVLLAQLFKVERSVASYCKVYKEQANKLTDAQGDTYAVSVFSHKSSNPADFADAFSRLEQVAPRDIEPDVKTLKQLFQKISDDPSQAMSASLSGLGAESNVKDWTIKNCGGTN